MAKQTLVSPEHIAKIRDLLRAVSKEKGEMRLALIARSPDSPDKWSFVVSGPWIDTEGPRASVGYLSSKLKQYLEKNSLSFIERISALRNDHRLVKTILQFLGLEQTLSAQPHLIRDFVIDDIRFPEALVFVADRYPEGKKVTQSHSQHTLSSQLG